MRPIACILLVIAGPLWGQATPEKAATVAFLHSLEQPSGGVANAPGEPPTLRSTTSGVRALKKFGDSAKHAEAHAAFFARCYEASSGGFGDRPGVAASALTTAVALSSANDLGVDVGRYRDAGLKFLNEQAKTFDEMRMTAAALETLQATSTRRDGFLADIAGQRNTDGSYGAGPLRVRQTGSVVAMVLRLGGPLDGREGATNCLRNGQLTDGGYGQKDTSDLDTTYRVMRSLHMLKTQPADPDKLRAFVAQCRTNGGGYAVAPAQSPTASGCYYAGSILHWLGEP